ncbi:MAG: hypothetical protein Phog2KO_18350 [Phototrophicaceae bacterium]
MNEDSLKNQDDDLKPTPPALPKPKPFHITEPHQEHGLWYFWLTSDDHILRYVQNLNCILKSKFGGSAFGQTRLRGRIKFAINPRYDHQETWLWIQDVLTSETSIVELGTNWEDAIQKAQKSSS